MAAAMAVTSEGGGVGGIVASLPDGIRSPATDPALSTAPGPAARIRSWPGAVRVGRGKVGALGKAISSRSELSAARRAAPALPRAPRMDTARAAEGAAADAGAEAAEEDEEEAAASTEAETEAVPTAREPRGVAALGLRWRKDFCGEFWWACTSELVGCTSEWHCATLMEPRAPMEPRSS